MCLSTDFIIKDSVLIGKKQYCDICCDNRIGKIKMPPLRRRPGLTYQMQISSFHMISSTWALVVFIIPTHFTGSEAFKRSFMPASFANAGTSVSSICLAASSVVFKSSYLAVLDFAAFCLDSVISILLWGTFCFNPALSVGTLNYTGSSFCSALWNRVIHCVPPLK